MSILKGILHHWNKTNSAYDTIHPETESAQITDWHSGIMASLASKTLGTVVDAVTTDSVLGKLIKMLLNASGVKYLIDTNGYICFGQYFGGLIIQWGEFYQIDAGAYITLPLSSEPIQVVANDMADEHNNTLCIGTSSYGKGEFRISGDRIKSSGSQLWGHWIAICK